MKEQGKSFKSKHPEGTKAEPKVIAALQEIVKERKVSCAAATLVAKNLGIPMITVGIAIDLQNYMIVDCQLGIFGENGKNITAATSVASGVENAIRNSLVNDRLPCENAWLLAKELQMSRKEIAQACEALKIKIKPCQLGAF